MTEQSRSGVTDTFEAQAHGRPLPFGVRGPELRVLDVVGLHEGVGRQAAQRGGPLLEFRDRATAEALPPVSEVDGDVTDLALCNQYCRNTS